MFSFSSASREILVAKFGKPLKEAFLALGEGGGEKFRERFGCQTRLKEAGSQMACCLFIGRLPCARHHAKS